MGEFVGPLIGGLMTKYFGYIKGCSYTGFGVMGIGLLYGLVFCEKKSKIVEVEENKNLMGNSQHKVILVISPKMTPIITSIE